MMFRKKQLGDFPSGERHEILPEGVRQSFAAFCQWGGWAGAFFIYFWSIAQYDPAEGRFAPQWIGFTFIICLFIGIVGTMVRSRMRLTATILAAFRAGMDAQKARNARTEDDLK